MEKYSQDNETLNENLRNEESQLMQKVAEFMGSGVKTAEEQNELAKLESRLHSVRAKITEIDLAKKTQN